MNRIPPLPLRPLLLALLIGLAGCARMPVDDHPLAMRDAASAQLAPNIHLAREGWPEARWWTRFQDPQLDRLMDQALKDAPSLQVAAARVNSARAAMQIDAADDGSSVAFKADTNRQRYSSNGLFPAPIGGSFINETTVQLGASYDFDWWGKRRARLQASLGEVNARRAEYAQAEQTLAAAVASNYFAMQGDFARLDNLRQMQATQEALVKDRAKRVAHGLGTREEQFGATRDLNTVKRDIAALETRINREREGLRALIGADSQALGDLAARPLPQDSAALPARLGLELLARRPDLQAERARVEASLSRIDLAKAAFYPDINLRGAIGLDSLDLEKLLRYSSRTLFIGPELSLPLFNSGTLQARLGAARDQRNELIADYNQSVLNAVREVAQAGASVQGLARQQEAQQAASDAASGKLRSAEARLKQGLADNSTILNARLASLEQQDRALQLDAERLQDDVALIKALGGGFHAAEPALASAAQANSNRN